MPFSEKCNYAIIYTKRALNFYESKVDFSWSTKEQFIHSFRQKKTEMVASSLLRGKRENIQFYSYICINSRVTIIHFSETCLHFGNKCITKHGII